MIYEELIKQLKDRAERFDYDGWVDTAIILEQAADAIEKLNKRVPVPPHGRLIDADALLDMMFKLVDEETFMAFQQAVNDAPTIIEVEESK